MIILRRISQILFFALFCVLLSLTRDSGGSNALWEPVKYFFDLDPLIALGVFCATHKILAGAVMAVLVLFLTLVFGRIFCGWVCPFGAIHHFLSAAGKRRTGPDQYAPAQRLKYLVLIVFLVGSLFSVNQIGWMDPISFLVRSMTLAIIPMIQYVTMALLNPLFYCRVGVVDDAAGRIADVLREYVFYFNLPHFTWTALFAVLFLAVVSLNFYRRRFWCRVLCPLGALLGAVSHFSFLRLRMDGECKNCLLCSRYCAGACNPHLKDGWISRECLMCYNCVKGCPSQVLRFHFGVRKGSAEPAFDIGRRRVLTSALLGLLAVPLLRGSFWAKRVEPCLIRPPGAFPEPEFLARCVKCGNCMKACPTHFLQPTFLEAGVEGMWSPMGVGRKGYCEYNCHLCAQACPTGAIVRLPLEEKKKTKIGTAFVDRSRCMTYAFDTPCLVCEEHCPTPKKAIWVEQVQVAKRDGTVITLGRPHVDIDLCIGCSICESVCTIVDKPAIHVTSIGESRSKENRFALR